MEVTETYFKHFFKEVKFLVILDKLVATDKPNEVTTDGMCYTVHVPLNLN